MTKDKDEHYIDVRFTFKRKTEQWQVGENTHEESFIDAHSMKRVKVKGLTEDELDHVGEMFAQVDKLQVELSSSMPTILADGGKVKF